MVMNQVVADPKELSQLNDPASRAETADAPRTVQGGDARPSQDLPERERNHRIGDELLAPAGQIGKIRANLRALEMLRTLEAEDRLPDSDEKRGAGAIHRTGATRRRSSTN